MQNPRAVSFSSQQNQHCLAAPKISVLITQSSMTEFKVTPQLNRAISSCLFFSRGIRFAV